MGTTTVRELRNRGGHVLDRVAAGEHITVTRDGKPVAELRPVPRPRATAAMLVERFKRLPPVDPAQLRADVDAVIDQAL
jgi:prevent-host-death family protein